MLTCGPTGRSEMAVDVIQAMEIRSGYVDYAVDLPNWG
jgi:hypothetical protein